MKVFAFYLPQYYPTELNDKTWGNGFTEWHNVSGGKKFFRNHKQPKLPGQLGFYDLRLTETRKEQGKLAKLFGIDGFSYWHYWSKGDLLLEKPTRLMLKDGYPDITFFFSWANHDWHKKSWSSKSSSWTSDKLLFKQLYGDNDDIISHFNYCLDFFRNKNYYKINNKPVFSFFAPLDITYSAQMFRIWNELALKNGFDGIYFIGQCRDLSNLSRIKQLKLDKINISLHRELFNKSQVKKIINRVLRRPGIYDYNKILPELDSQLFEDEDIIPTIIPNWDHTPRSGLYGNLFTNSNPKNFSKHLKQIFKRVENKKNKIILLKSWNEWGEGNYLEPDFEFQTQYLKEFRKIKDLYDK